MKPAATIIKNFFRHDNFYLASNISFCALLSLAPMLLIVFSFVGFMLGSSQDVYQQLVIAITDVLPQAKNLLVHNLHEVIGKRHSFGALGLLFLVFISTLLFASIERALDLIFETEKKRNFLYSRLIAITLMGLISLCFFLPTIADLMTQSLARYGFHFPLGELLRGKLFFFLFAFLAFVLVILLIPHRRIRMKYAALGGVVFAVGIFFAKQFFRWYFLRVFARYNLIYGSLSAFILLILWIYYVVNILLFAAEVVAYLQLKSSPPVLNPPQDVCKFQNKHSA